MGSIKQKLHSILVNGDTSKASNIGIKPAERFFECTSHDDAGASIGGYESAGYSMCSKSKSARTVGCQFESPEVLLENSQPPS